MSEKIFTKLIEGEKVRCVLEGNTYKIYVKDEELVANDPRDITRIASEVINRCRYKPLLDDGWIEDQQVMPRQIQAFVKVVDNSRDKNLELLKDRLRNIAMNIVIDAGTEGVCKCELNESLKYSKIGNQADIVKVSKETLDNMAAGKLIFFKHLPRVGAGARKVMVYPIVARMSEWQKLHKAEQVSRPLAQSFVFAGENRLAKPLSDSDVRKNDISISEHGTENRIHFNADSHPLRHN
jgi:hypothetical protein